MMRHKWFWGILVCLITSPVAAQQAQPVQPVAEYTLKLTGQELDLIGKALGTQPFNDVVGLINKMRQQFIEQQKSVKSTEPSEKPVDKKE